MDAATLKLFNAVQVGSHLETIHSDEVTERCVRNGYILDPAVVPDNSLLNTIESVVGISGEKANATFHKSWSVVHDASIEQLVLQQIVHYITTYGFEALGIYDQDTVYIPAEVLELPEIKERIPLTVVHAMTKEEVLSAIVNLAGSGIALHEETLNDIMVIVEANRYEPDFVEGIKNRELKTRLCDYYHIVPSEPTEYLRYVISKLTDESLIIKNDYLIGKIKEANGKFLDELLQYAPKDLASIFLRYKPLFLALKSISRNKGFFNRLRKRAVKMHEPLPTDYLNSVTEQIMRGRLDLDLLGDRLRSASVFRKIRLAYALRYRLTYGTSIVYRVRNGRGWATDFMWSSELEETTKSAFDIVMNAISSALSDSLNGKTFYIPSHVHYALPATEKQFVGAIPSGSYVSVPQNMVAGIHWTNTKKRVDLDLSVTDANAKVGWDASYRTPARSVMFSGDITDAPKPKGATELFYFKNELRSAMLMHVNYYNYSDGDEVQTKIIVASHEAALGESHTFDISNMLATALINVNQKQTTLGLIINTQGENRFYFSPVSIGKGITSSVSEPAKHTRNYYVNSLVNGIDLAEVLTMAGASVTDERPESGDFVDLSPENLDKNTIINIVSPSS